MKPEEFCSYMLSMRLKVRGFNEECDYYYTDNGLLSHISNKNELLSEDRCSAPIYQKALRWVMEKYLLRVSPAYCRFTDGFGRETYKWESTVISLRTGELVHPIGRGEYYYDTLNEAIEQGINHVLDTQAW